MNAEQIVDYVNSEQFIADLRKGIISKLKKLNFPKSAKEIRKIGAKNIIRKCYITFNYLNDLDTRMILGLTDKELLVKDDRNFKCKTSRIPFSYLDFAELTEIAWNFHREDMYEKVVE